MSDAVSYFPNASLSWEVWSSDSSPGHWPHYHLELGFTYYMTHALEIYGSVAASIFTQLWMIVTISFKHFIISKPLYPLVITPISYVLPYPHPLPSLRLARSSSEHVALPVPSVSCLLQSMLYHMLATCHHSIDLQAVSYPVF